jgi:hypothetical protein
LDRAAALLPEGDRERIVLYEARAKFTSTDGDPETAWIQLIGVRKRLSEPLNYTSARD